MRIFDAVVGLFRGPADQGDRLPADQGDRLPAEPEVAEIEPEVAEIEPEVAEIEPEIDRHAAPEYDLDLIAAGRAWIGECVWADLEPDYVADLTPDEVISGIARHYDGGVRAFEESGYDVVDAPLPFDVDENGFPTDHRTFQSHTLPDDTHSWLCGKAGCYNSAPDYATPDEALAAAHEHEISHGYDRELEVAAPVAVAELDEPEPDIESPVVEDGAGTIEDLSVSADELEVVEPEREMQAHIVSVDGLAACTGERAPNDAVEIVNPTADEKCPDCVQWEKDCDHQLVMDVQDMQVPEELELDEATAAPEPAAEGGVTIEDMQVPAALDDGVTIEDAELDGQTGAVTIEDAEPEVTIEDVEPAAAPEVAVVHTEALELPEDGVCELPGSEPEVAEPEVAEPEVAEPEPVLTDTQQKAVVWTNALEDGTHTQAHGVWQKEGVFGGIKAECTIRAGGNVLGLTDHEMKETFGDELFYDVLDRNDHEHQDYSQISKAIKKDQGIADLEMGR